ncbi:1-acyl-sn-glycerol-3-phosphate acyltransferase [Sinirhodobacter populi]|uniref:1-acyl-sn-glycerol-3-phosphate acyltransferase n=1 Tax=Paenirhodobacter populi TaxID=2306993 RepID=A0A443K1D5_9RHOB|nr:lysophospholipid acyltransferase family protein [Sinirhodobacter populi]RWR26568.1 1-acyl-sn-glycerol-3-phosphate acyltransferase [Sinirhodobacter populi]
MIVVQYIRSVIFIVQMYLAMALIGVCLFPVALIGGRSVAIGICRLFCHWVRFSARWIVGLRTEVRGAVPTGDVLIAAKHQSFLDILLIYSALPRGKFVMKKELVQTPFVGWYARLIGCIPVDRGKRGAAIKAMLAAVRNPRFAGGQLIIFPQGTRVAPGAKMDYKIGAAALYHALKQPCVPVATNVGVFWGRHSLLRKPGLAVVEFLSEIPPGEELHAFTRQIEAAIETASDRLMAEAGFRA